MPSPSPSGPAPPSDAPRFLALGDSYTIGEGVAAEGRWPVQLAAALRASGSPVADPEIVAVTGWTVAELDAGIDAAGPHAPFDLVTLLIGVNDQYRGHDLGGYRTQYRTMLARAIGFAGGDPARVVAVSFPDWGVTPFAADRDAAQVAHEVDAFNAAARAIAEGEGVAWVDVTPLSREQGDQVVGDGLHPDANAYVGWVERILPAATAALAD
ncbi:SGNH/GDSL hydrolase family protein [Rubrivirga sp. IMCC43871]|uniref:SGNH/GDSL hydrolase family protein n=1 Tax=Rubrivirga sp. IMCC43871 TaxID=3391575 RepID=UPI00398FFFCF